MAGRTAEGNARISTKNTGRKHTPEAIEKITAASRAMSPEKRAEMAAASKASGVHERQATKLRGVKKSPETCAAMSARSKGVPKSLAHRAATSEAIKLWHAKRRRVNAWIDTHLGMRPDVIDWEVAA